MSRFPSLTVVLVLLLAAVPQRAHAQRTTDSASISAATRRQHDSLVIDALRHPRHKPARAMKGAAAQIVERQRAAAVAATGPRETPLPTRRAKQSPR
jgi:hypothetical protein